MRVLESGETVIVDTHAIYQRIISIFWSVVNLGELYAIASTFFKNVGY
jgi:hypothetical protein